MAVSLETEWMLVASGLIAHADDELDGAEVDRLMNMVDDRIPEEDYADWLALIGDKQALEGKLGELADPPVSEHRTILEEAWTMAMVDGERQTAELVILARLAERLGVEPVQLEFWREAWTANEQQFGDLVARLAAYCLGQGQPVYEDDHSSFLDLLQVLPISNAERERLGALATEPSGDGEAIARELASMARNRRVQAFRLVSPLVRTSIREDAARETFATVAKAAGLLDPDALHR